MARYLTQRYDGSVATRFYDLANPRTREEHPEMAKAVDARRRNLPLVAIDEKILLEGYVDHRAIVSFIDDKRAQQR